MNAVSLPTIAMAAVSLYVGSYHLLLFARRRQHREDLTFAILCIVNALYDIFCFDLYNSSSVAEGVLWQKAQFISLAFFSTAFLWFMADYTRSKPGIVIYLFTIYYAAAVIVQIIDRSGLTFDISNPSIKEILLPLNLRITYYEAALGPFTVSQGLIGLAFSAYVYWNGVRFFLRGPRKEAGPLLLALSLMLVAAINDTLLSNDLYRFIYLIEYSYLAMIVVMAFSLSGTVVEAALAREELHKAHVVIENSPVVLFRWIARDNWPVEYVSENVSQFGYSAAEMMSGEVIYSTLVHPDDLERIAGEVNRHIAARAKGYGQEYRIVTRDGRVRWVDDRTIVERDSGGKVTHFQGIVIDITERKAAEKALQESEEKFRSLVENSLSGVFSVDDAFRFIYCNDEFCSLLGYPREKLLELDFRQVLSGNSRELVADRYVRRQRGEILPSRYPVEVIRSDGELRHFEMSITVAKNQAGQPRTLGQIVDITERTRAEDEIRRLNSELERRVVERTAELENALKELEAFSYSVSHDLRAPLRTMSGFSRILLAEFAPHLPPEAARHLSTIHESSLLMGRLVDGLLNFSRLSRQPLKMQPIVMEELAAEALHSLGDEQGGRNIKIVMGSLPACQGDPILLRQVWVNLISNALKFTRGRPEARIEIGCLDGTDGKAVYFIKDNGVGFDNRYTGRLFGVFQRLHGSDEFEGTGIGLAIVQRIVQRHGGHVWAESEAGQGASFYFSLG